MRLDENIKELALVADIFNDIGAPWWISDYSALMAYRKEYGSGAEQKVSGISVSVATKPSKAKNHLLCERLRKIFGKNKFQILEQVHANNYCSGIVFVKRGFVVQITCYLVTKKGVINYGKEGYLTLPKKLIANMHTITIGETEFSIPTPEAEYFTALYGNKWKEYTFTRKPTKNLTFWKKVARQDHLVRRQSWLIKVLGY